MSKNFFDYNSTTPVCPEALEAMLPYFSDVFANPSGQTSQMSWKSQAAIKTAKKEVASLLGCSFDEITFTSGATESITWVFEDFMKNNKNVLVSNIDHDAAYEKAKGQVTFRSNLDGSPDIEDFSLKLKNLEKGSLVSFISAHNELGTIIELEPLIKQAKENGHFVHLDATQALGKFDFNFKNLNADFLSCSAHKVYGPKGIGTLVINKSSVSSIDPLIYGGGQQDGLRSGTINTPLIVGFGKACQVAKPRIQKDQEHYKILRTIFLDSLKGLDFTLNGSQNSLLNTINITFHDWKSLAPLYLELLPFSVSQSSACSSEDNKKRILSALNIPEAQTIRVSFGRASTEENTKELAQKILSTVLK